MYTPREAFESARLSADSVPKHSGTKRGGEDALQYRQSIKHTLKDSRNVRQEKRPEQFPAPPGRESPFTASALLPGRRQKN